MDNQTKNIARIIIACCEACNVSPSAIRTTDRIGATARAIASYHLVRAGLRRREIGELFNRQHSAITHSLRRVERDLSTQDRIFCKQFSEAQRLMNQTKNKI